MVTLCQCNIHESGRWTERNTSRITFDTAGRFARFVASVNSPISPGSPHPPISAIGMQELLAEDDRMTINAYLEEATQTTWTSAYTAQGVNNRSGIGMFWRPDILEFRPEWYLGSTVVDVLDNNYVIRFVGRVFTVVDSQESFAFITGKLVWDSGILNGHRVIEEDRRQEAVRIKQWISSGDQETPGMSMFPDLPRVIATDLNTDVGTPTWREMNADYTDPGRQHTFNSFMGSTLMDAVGKRIDYLWLSRDPSGSRGWRFIDGPHRSPHFGSDHRAVYATIDLGGGS